MPVILARRGREVGRNGYELRAFEREDPVELRKTHVVADGQPELSVLRLDDDRLLPRLLRFGLPVDDTADLNVEEMDLAIDGHDLPVGVEHEARVRAFLAPLAKLDDRTTNQRYPLRWR